MEPETTIFDHLLPLAKLRINDPRVQEAAAKTGKDAISALQDPEAMALLPVHLTQCTACLQSPSIK